MIDLVSIVGDYNSSSTLPYLAQYSIFYPLLKIVSPWVIQTTNVKDICNELDAIVDALVKDTNTNYRVHLMLVFSSNVLVPYFQGTYRVSGENISRMYPNVYFYIGMNTMANPLNPQDARTVMIENPNAYRFGDVLSANSIPVITSGLEKVWGSSITPKVWYVYEAGDNASRSFLASFTKAVKQLGWPSIDYPVIYTNNEFDLTKVREAIQKNPIGHYVIILIAVNASLANAFTVSGLKETKELPAFFNTSQSEWIRWTDMNYTPSFAIPVDFHFVKPYPVQEYSKLDAVIVPRPKLPLLPYLIENYAEIMGYISNPNLNFVGTMDNRFYLESV